MSQNPYIYVCVYTYVIVRVLQRNWTNRRYIYRDLLEVIGSCNFGGWEGPWSAISWLETQQSQLWRVQSEPEEPGTPRRGHWCPSSTVGQRANPTFLHFSALSRPATNGMLFTCIEGRAICFISSPIWMLISLGYPLTDTSTYVDQISGHPLAQCDRYIKWTITTYKNKGFTK